jgi:hypothetical protein
LISSSVGGVSSVIADRSSAIAFHPAGVLRPWERHSKPSVETEHEHVRRIDLGLTD